MVKYIVQFPFNAVARILSTAYYWTKECTTDKGKDVLKFRKFKKNLCKTVPFSLTLQPSCPLFLTSANTDSKENVSFKCSEIVGSLPEKGLYEII